MPTDTANSCISNRNCCSLKTKWPFNQPLPSSGWPCPKRFPTLPYRKKIAMLQGQHFKIRSILDPYPQEQSTTQMFCRNTKRGNSISHPRDEPRELISSGHPSARGFLQTVKKNIIHQENMADPGEELKEKEKWLLEKWDADRNHPQTSIPSQSYWEYFCYF